MGFFVSCHLGIATTTDGLRLGSSLKDISSGRPRGQKLVYPIAHMIIIIISYHHLSILPAIAFYTPHRRCCCTVTLVSNLDALIYVAPACRHMALRHLLERSHLRAVSDSKTPNLAFVPSI
jgi:hypothetical protein